MPFVTERGLNDAGPSSPHHHNGTVVNEIVDNDSDDNADADVGNRGGFSSPTIGDHITVLHGAIRQNVLFVPIMEALKEVQIEESAEQSRGVNEVATAARP